MQGQHLTVYSHPEGLPRCLVSGQPCHGQSPFLRFGRCGCLQRDLAGSAPNILTFCHRSSGVEGFGLCFRAYVTGSFNRSQRFNFCEQFAFLGPGQVGTCRCDPGAPLDSRGIRRFCLRYISRWLKHYLIIDGSQAAKVRWGSRAVFVPKTCGLSPKAFLQTLPCLNPNWRFRVPRWLLRPAMVQPTPERWKVRVAHNAENWSKAHLNRTPDSRPRWKSVGIKKIRVSFSSYSVFKNSCQREDRGRS